MRDNRLQSVGVVCAGVLLLMTLATKGSAQDLDSLRRRYTLPVLPVDVITVAINVARVQPGSSSGSPSAFGANMGDAFVGAGYQNQVRYVGPKPSVLDDGGVVAGFGLGDAWEYVGLEVAISSFSTVREGFGKRGAVSLKLHRVLPDGFGLAVGRESAVSWGGTDGGRSWYGVVSKVVGLTPNPNGFLGSVVLNAGIGDGRFRDTHISTLPSGQQVLGTPQDSLGFFASAGLRVHETTSVIADWGGSDLTIGLSIVPFGSIPFVVSPAIADVLARANGHGRFILGVGYGFRLSQLAHF